MTVFPKLGVTQRVGITGGAVPVGRLDHKHFGVCSCQRIGPSRFTHFRGRLTFSASWKLDCADTLDGFRQIGALSLVSIEMRMTAAC